MSPAVAAARIFPGLGSVPRCTWRSAFHRSLRTMAREIQLDAMNRLLSQTLDEQARA